MTDIWAADLTDDPGELPERHPWEAEIKQLRQELAEAKAALEDLLDLQTGPPLLRDEEAFYDAEARCCKVLGWQYTRPKSILKGKREA